MKKKDLIKKWLDNEPLTSIESKAFKDLDAYDSYMKISETAQKIEPPKYDIEDGLENLNNTLKDHKKPVQLKPYFTTLLKIAAIFVLGIGTYFTFFNNSATMVDTKVSEHTSFELPDKSLVWLNSLSSIKYEEKDWSNNRLIKLDGEAYFKVAKGKKFIVYTKSGIVTVIGTIFNVKQRDDYLEVVCYEGIVSVSDTNETIYLRQGDAAEIKDQKLNKKTTSLRSPYWLKNRSIFMSTPYAEVIKEFEWQYGVKIIAENIDKTKLFTGNFVHSDIQMGLQSITLSMHLKYKINGNNVTLYKE